MFSYIEVFQGVFYTVFLFAGFRGHVHPWTPITPLSFDEVHDRQTYYRAWYKPTDHDDQLNKLQKYFLIFQNVDSNRPSVAKQGYHYYSVTKVKGQWLIGNVITADQALKRKHYAVVVSKDGATVRCNLVYAKMISEIVYHYNNKGLLVDKEIVVNEIPKGIE